MCMDWSAWLDADAATAQGCYLAALLRWPGVYGEADGWFDLGAWPRPLDFATRTEQRPASVKAAFAEGLGPRPFSAPIGCIPAQGSAT